MGGRYIIEGEWLGYRSSQDKIVHRTVHSAAFKKLRAWAERTHAITYSDGTQLRLTVRDCKPRERVQVISGYTRLIQDCAYYDVDTVDALCGIENKRREEFAARRATGATTKETEA